MPVIIRLSTHIYHDHACACLTSIPDSTAGMDTKVTKSPFTERRVRFADPHEMNGLDIERSPPPTVKSPASWDSGTFSYGNGSPRSPTSPTSPIIRSGGLENLASVNGDTSTPTTATKDGKMLKAIQTTATQRSMPRKFFFEGTENNSSTVNRITSGKNGLRITERTVDINSNERAQSPDKPVDTSLRVDVHLPPLHELLKGTPGTGLRRKVRAKKFGICDMLGSTDNVGLEQDDITPAPLLSPDPEPMYRSSPVPVVPIVSPVVNSGPVLSPSFAESPTHETPIRKSRKKKFLSPLDMLGATNSTESLSESVMSFEQNEAAELGPFDSPLWTSPESFPAYEKPHEAWWERNKHIKPVRPRHNSESAAHDNLTHIRERDQYFKKAVSPYAKFFKPKPKQQPTVPNVSQHYRQPVLRVSQPPPPNSSPSPTREGPVPHQQPHRSSANTRKTPPKVPPKTLPKPNMKRYSPNSNSNNKAYSPTSPTDGRTSSPELSELERLEQAIFGKGPAANSTFQSPDPPEDDSDTEVASPYSLPVAALSSKMSNDLRNLVADLSSISADIGKSKYTKDPAEAENAETVPTSDTDDEDYRFNENDEDGVYFKRSPEDDKSTSSSGSRRRPKSAGAERPAQDSGSQFARFSSTRTSLRSSRWSKGEKSSSTRSSPDRSTPASSCSPLPDTPKTPLRRRNSFGGEDSPRSGIPVLRRSRYYL